jgi:PhzF family phenazine biosynthesis protein
MGEVYRARDPALGREVAIKIIAAPLAAGEDGQARFQREARVLASLNHPHIASVFGLVEEGSVRGLVMELVEGPTLGTDREDPATGSANGPLGCYLVRYGLVPRERAGHIVSRQGVKMQRPSRLHIRIAGEPENISGVQVGGASVLIGEGRLEAIGMPEVKR